MYIVSACLAGFNTRYDGGNSLHEKVRALVASGEAIAVCPEQLAGLTTPRAPVEFESGDGGGLLDGSGRVLSADEKDFSEALVRGAKETLRIARMFGVKKAILKDGSPSCGSTYVYSGGAKCPGRGVCAELLMRNDLEVVTADTLC
jgi:uncharacterized protein YbbK (DUF523 family)